MKLLLATLLLQACVVSVTFPEYDVKLDSSFTAGEVTNIKDALHEWETRTGERVHFTVSSTDKIPSLPWNGVYIHRVVGSTCPAGRDLRPHAGLTYLALGGHVECIDANTAGGVYFYQIVLHETGHVLGLHHTTDVRQFCSVTGLC